MLAGIAAACLDGLLAVQRDHVVIVSGSFEQAQIASRDSCRDTVETDPPVEPDVAPPSLWGDLEQIRAEPDLSHITFHDPSASCKCRFILGGGAGLADAWRR